MNWKIKAAVQNACAALPVFREEVYFGIQKVFGDVANKPDPIQMMGAAAEITELLQKAGRPVEGARVFEVGTGRRIDMPLGLFLAGAKSVTTVDLHCYLKPELVMACLGRIRDNRSQIRKFFVPLTNPVELDRRLDLLCSVTSFDDLITKTNVIYRAPSDAASTGLPDGSVDVHISYTVFEHIPGPVLVAILKESSRLLSDTGLALHHIDLSDHFAQDGEIDKINFLQYSQKEWDGYADNQFAYHNRLRPSEYCAIYDAAGHAVLEWIPHVDQQSMTALTKGFPVDPSFSSHPPQELCTAVLQVISRPMERQAPAGSFVNS
jgi:hypothetical protein